MACDGLGGANHASLPGRSPPMKMVSAFCGHLEFAMKNPAFAALVTAAIAAGALTGCGGSSEPNADVPADIRAVMNQARYAGARWGLRVVDAQTGKVVLDTQPDHAFYIGSVRKLFSVGELLDQTGPDHRYNTPVYRQGVVSGGVLNGNLVLVASGDLTMGGRTNPDGSIAISDYDHNEANSLGNAVLTPPDPLAGYRSLARQVAASGITRITGQVIVDDRLFQPFPYRGEFDLRPIFVNDDMIDLTINPTAPGQAASLDWRPKSSALGVSNALTTSAAGSELAFELTPEFSSCIGAPGCSTRVSGAIPMDFKPRFTGRFPLVRSIRMTRPDNYARTVLIEALVDAGVVVDAPPVQENPVQLLPPRDSWAEADKVAELAGMPYADYAKLILKVSYNLGADTSLLLWGKTQGVDNMDATLAREQVHLANQYGVQRGDYAFFNGSGGGDTKALTRAVTIFLARMRQSAHFDTYFDALPILGTDGSLAFVKDYAADASLAGATGQVRAKTGTNIEAAGAGLLLKGQALGGYIRTRSGRDLIYALVVNNAKVADIDAVAQVFQDEGTISALLWRDY